MGMDKDQGDMDVGELMIGGGDMDVRELTPMIGGCTRMGMDKDQGDMDVGELMIGGATLMDVDKDQNVNNSNQTKGTIRAYFSQLHLKGMKTTNHFQEERINGGGSSTTTTRLKTTMKKVRTSKKKMGILPKRGAKSRMLSEQLTRDKESVSTQREIGHFFSKIEGIIGSGLGKKLGRIPMGYGQKPL